MSKGKFTLLAIALVTVIAGASLYVFLTRHGFSAREKPTGYEEWLARHARRLATEPGARQRKNPLAGTELVVAEARDHYADHCAVCHGNDGSGKTMIGQSLYPPSPDMRTGETQKLTDGELFSIIKNGVRFTGMPGWGGEDDDNWKLVLFIRHLPQLSPAERKLMNEVNQLDNMDMDDQNHGTKSSTKLGTEHSSVSGDKKE